MRIGRRMPIAPAAIAATGAIHRRSIGRAACSRLARTVIVPRSKLPNPRLRTDMPRLSRLFALALAATAACTSAIPAPEGPAPVTPAPAQAGDVAAARAKWDARKPAAYAYDFSVTCFCIHRGEYAVEVRGGRISSLRAKDTGAAVPEDRAAYILTVDGLFDRLAAASREGTPVRAAYDAALGYPAEAEIGMLANDSGTLYRIANLRPL